MVTENCRVMGIPFRYLANDQVLANFGFYNDALQSLFDLNAHFAASEREVNTRIVTLFGAP